MELDKIMLIFVDQKKKEWGVDSHSDMKIHSKATVFKITTQKYVCEYRGEKYILVFVGI